MNWKLVVVGGLAYYAVTWIVSFGTDPLIHNGVLLETYQANPEFWRPELNQNPPDMAALMPYWLTTGVLGSLITALVYGWVRPAFQGAGWMKGLKYGGVLFLLACTLYLGWSGIFGLPGHMWAWWAGEGLVYYLLGGIALGWVGSKLAPEGG